MNFTNFKEFYDYYLSQHSNRMCRRLHFTGTTFAIILLVTAVVTKNWSLLWGVPAAGYCIAWIGHWVFEGNNPASFKYPLRSFRADVTMYYEMLRGKITF